MAAPTEERRRSERVPLLVRVECKTRRKYILGRCENISETGMLVYASETYEVAETVTLRFLLPPIALGKAIETAATVVRSIPGELMALDFVRLPAASKEALNRYILKNSKT